MADVRHLDEIHAVGAETRERLVGRDACPALRDHGILLCGVSEARPGFRFVRHDWDCAQVLACTGGRGRVLVDRELPWLAAGQAYLDPPHRMHAYHAAGAEPWLLAWVIAEGGALPIGGSPRITAAGDAEPLRDAILGLYREVLGSSSPTLLAQYAGLVALLARRIADPTPDPSLRALWEAVAFDLARPWTLDGLARQAGMPAERLRRRCQRETGMSPMRRVAELRLRHAAGLLATTALSVAEVAARVGYADPFAFSTAFRRLHGRTPSSMR